MTCDKILYPIIKITAVGDMDMHIPSAVQLHTSHLAHRCSTA